MTCASAAGKNLEERNTCNKALLKCIEAGHRRLSAAPGPGRSDSAVRHVSPCNGHLCDGSVVEEAQTGGEEQHPSHVLR